VNIKTQLIFNKTTCLGTKTNIFVSALSRAWAADRLWGFSNIIFVMHEMMTCLKKAYLNVKMIPVSATNKMVVICVS